MVSPDHNDIYSNNETQRDSVNTASTYLDNKPLNNQDLNWQKRLLPWLILVPTLLIVSFIVFSSIRMSKMETYIYQNDTLKVSNSFAPPDKLDLTVITNDKLQYIKLYALTEMEQFSINKRYNQAAIISMSTIYTKYLGFFTGMVIGIVGAVFIISKLKESSTNFEGSYNEQIRFKLLTSSPGVIFALLGTTLMIITIMHKGEVNVNDSPLYLNHYNLHYSTDLINQTGFDSANINNLTDTINQGGWISPEEADSVDLNK